MHKQRRMSGIGELSIGSRRRDAMRTSWCSVRAAQSKRLRCHRQGADWRRAVRNDCIYLTSGELSPHRLLGWVKYSTEPAAIVVILNKAASGSWSPLCGRPGASRKAIKPGDVLIEGQIGTPGDHKDLTRATWSHASLAFGEIAGRRTASGSAADMIQSMLDDALIGVLPSKYFSFIARLPASRAQPPSRSAESLELRDRAEWLQQRPQETRPRRHLVPLLVPQALRGRRLGSGDPTRSSSSVRLIAQAFDSVGDPILPSIERVGSEQARAEIFHREILLDAARSSNFPDFRRDSVTIEAASTIRS